jgi:Uma2 family endonuclease
MHRKFDPTELPLPAIPYETDLQVPCFTMPVSVCTLDGFREWITSEAAPEFGRIAFLNGEVFIDMTNERVDTHGLLRLEYDRGFSNLLREEDLGLYFPDGCRLSNRKAKLSTAPDGFFATWKTLQSNRLRRIPMARGAGVRELEGTPDMVLEILSDSSVNKDLVVLRGRYHKAGIDEYWLVDARGDEIEFQLLRWSPADYAPVQPQRGGWLPSAVFGCKFRLTRKRNRIGMWQYTLEVRR